MERRRFLVLASAVGASGMLGSRGPAWAQAGAGPRPRSRPGSTPLAEAPTASAPGVSARDIKIGMSAAFKGPAAGLGTELWRGASAYFAEINGRGGVNGRSIVVTALDDGYQPDPCLRNTIQLVEQDQVFSLSNYVGTRILTKVTVEALRRAGVNPTRASLRQSPESLHEVDLGIGAPLSFGPERHQGLDSVYFTRVQDQHWVPVTDWTAAVRA
jgi:hypothetical protein